MSNNIHIFGLSRSGNHFIIDWLLNHLDGYTHVNAPSKHGYIGYRKGLDVGNKSVFSYENTIDIGDDDLDKFIVLRSYYNMLASKLWRIDRLDFDYQKIWKHNANFCIKNPHKCILYDRLISEDEYRLSIESNREWPNIKIPTKVNNKYGCGSSFGDKVVDNNETIFRFKQILELDVNDKRLIDYKRLSNDEDIRNLNKELFGWCLNEKYEYEKT